MSGPGGRYSATFSGGLSGPAIRPIALRMVWQASQAVQIPICGIGGIMTAEDAVKFLLCGATAIQVGTSANYLNPMAAGEIADGIAAYAAEHGFARVRDLTGAPGDSRALISPGDCGWPLPFLCQFV